MNTIHKIATFTVLSLLPQSLVFADSIIIQLQSPLKNNASVASVMEAFFKILIEIGAVAVTLAIVYAGFLFVVAQGNPSKLEEAKKTLFYTIIGAMVLLGAQVIAKVIESTIKQLQ